jgi:hypothetical protein
VRKTLFIGLLLAFPLHSQAQEEQGRVDQYVRDLSPQRAQRLFKALNVSGGALYEFREETGAAKDEVKLGIRWEPTSPQKSRSGWSLRGRLKAAIMKNPDFMTTNMLRASYRYGISLLENTRRAADMKFVYDKIVHVRYRRASRELCITMDSEEEHGAFNMTVSETVRSSFQGAGGFGVATGSLSLDVSAEGSQVTVVAAGLPYVVRPLLRVRTIDGGDYLTAEWGLIWESRVNLEAVAHGATDDFNGGGKLALGWDDGSGSIDRVEVEARGYSERKGFESRLNMQAEGDGFTVSLLYDERVPHRAYDLAARANMRWHVHVAGTPIVKAGSIQEERTRSVGKKTLPVYPFGLLSLIEMPWLPSWAPGDAPGGALPDSRASVPAPAGFCTHDVRWSRIRGRYDPRAGSTVSPSATPQLRGLIDAMPVGSD